MKNKKILVIGAVLLAVLIALFAVLYNRFMPKGEEGAKTIYVTVIHPDREDKEFTISTNAAYLGDALQEQKLIEGTMGDYGLYITAVDGLQADETKQQWWCITKGTEQVNTGADTTPIADGDRFELSLLTW